MDLSSLSLSGARPLFWLTPLALIAVAFAAFLSKYYLAGRRPKDFPPGPPTAPFIGNIHQLPPRKIFLKFQELGRKYGSIVGLKIGSQNFVVLNHYKHVKELFDKRGSIYSSKSHSYISNELVCPNDVHILFIPYGEAWRKERKIVQQFLNVRAVDNLFHIQSAEATQTVYQILQSPELYYAHIRRYSTAVILASVFGQRGASYESPKVQALYHAQDQFTDLFEPGATPPVDAFPFLQYLPEILAPWKKRARSLRVEQKALYLSLLNETKESIRKGKLEDCFMGKVLSSQEKIELDDEHIAYLGGILMEAGSDTTASALLCFLLAMIKYPAVLKKAQEEVDSVCGDSRSPTFDDVSKFQYIRACMNEVLRWRPAAPGFMHMLQQDDTYEGYFIPKGTILYANSWAMHRDEEEYEKPDDFIPERFLNNKFGTRYDIIDDDRRGTYAFGAGRRICPGQRLSENSLMINMAKLVWTLDMLPGAGEVDADIETAFTDGFLTAPHKFPAQFKPRSEKRVEVIKNDLEAAKLIFAKYEN